MQMSGEQLIPTHQQAVWEALNDPEVLRDCIPGCESVEKAGDHDYRFRLAAVVGPVRAKFNGTLTLTDLEPPRAYRMLFEGQGGAAGFGKGEAHVRLAPEGEATRMTYDAKAQVGGKLAQIGSRLVDGVAHKVAREFFERFSARVAPPAQAPGAPRAGEASNGAVARIKLPPAVIWGLATVLLAIVGYAALFFRTG